MLRVKRVYERAEPGDGLRVLVDRLWPRGIAREKARVDLWLKDIAPSDALRRRVHGDPDAWDSFVAGYAVELTRPAADAAVRELRGHMTAGPVTLLYAARNEVRNNAVALKSWLESDPGEPDAHSLALPNDDSVASADVQAPSLLDVAQGLVNKVGEREP